MRCAHRLLCVSIVVGIAAAPTDAGPRLSRMAAASRRPLISLLSLSVATIGGTADAIATHLEHNRSRSLQQVGRTVRFWLGKETLGKSSINLSFGLALSPPFLAYVGNVGGKLGFWTGSAEYWQSNNNQPTDVHFDVDRGLFTAIGGVGYSRLSGPTRAIRLPYVGAYESARSYGFSVGLANVLQLGLGEVNAKAPGQYDRGPYLSLGAGIPVAAVRVSFGFTLHYPPIRLLTRLLHRPINRLRNFQERIAGWFRRAPTEQPKSR